MRFCLPTPGRDGERIRAPKEGRIGPQRIGRAREEGSVPSARSHHAVGTPTPLQHQELWLGESLPAEPQGQGQPPQAPRDSLCPHGRQLGHPKCPQNVVGGWDRAQHPR